MLPLLRGSVGLLTLPTKVPAILASAAAYWKSVDHDGSQVLADGSGNGHDAQQGSTSGADANDGKWLEYAGEQYIYAPALSGNYISTPDQAGFTGITVLDFDVAVAMADWTPGSSVLLAGQDDLSAARVWHLMLQGSGALRFSWWNSSGSANNADSLALGFSDLAKKWVRVVFDTAGFVDFYTSDDGEAWTLNRSNVVAATSLDDEASALMVGGNSSGGFMPEGKFYRARLYSGLRSSGGTLVVDFDASFADPESSTFISATGETWTLNRSASGRKLVVVDSDRFADGTDDYFAVADAAALDFAAGDSFTVTRRFRMYGTPAANQVLLAKKINLTTGAGYALYLDTSRRVVGIIADGTNSTTVTSTALTAGVEYTASLVRDVASDTVRLVINGVQHGSATDTTTGSLANAEELRFSRLSGAGTSYANEEFVAASIIPARLSAGQCATLATELVTAAA